MVLGIENEIYDDFFSEFFDENEFWMDHPGFPWEQMHFKRMETIMELERILQAAPFLFRRMKFIKSMSLFGEMFSKDLA